MPRICSLGTSAPNIECGVPAWSFKQSLVNLGNCDKDTKGHLAQLGLKQHPILNEYELILCRLGFFDTSKEQAEKLLVCVNHRHELGMGFHRKNFCMLHKALTGSETTKKDGVVSVVGLAEAKLLKKMVNEAVPIGAGLCNGCSQEFQRFRKSSSDGQTTASAQVVIPIQEPEYGAATTTHDPSAASGRGTDSKRERTTGGYQPPSGSGKRGRYPSIRELLTRDQKKPEPSDSHSSSDDEQVEEDDGQPQVCCLDQCERDTDLRGLELFRGIWTLKDHCLGKNPKRLKVCSQHRKNENKISGHPPKLKKTLAPELKALFAEETTTIKSLKCADRRCKRQGTEVVVAHTVSGTACPYHIITVRTPSLGDCNIYYPCDSFCSEAEHRRTVDSSSSNPEIFVCNSCGPQFKYFAVDMEKDIQAQVEFLEDEERPGLTAVATKESIKSPGVVEAIKNKLANIWNQPGKRRCEGMTDPHLIQWYYDEMAKKKPLTVPGLVMIRLPDGEQSVLFSHNCTGRKKTQSSRCDQCGNLYRKYNFRRIIQTRKEMAQRETNAKTNISAMNRDQLKDEVIKLRAHLKNAMFEAKVLKAQLRELEKQVEMPTTLKLTALRFEMLIETAQKAGIVEQNSPLFLLLLATVKNLRVQESKKSSRKGRSRGYRYSKGVLKVAAWLLHKCRKAGYTAIAEILPGLPSLHTMQKIRSAFRRTTDPIDIPSLESMLTLMKQHKGDKPWVGGIAWDEMSIQKGLVISQRTGEAVGFEDLLDPTEMEKMYTTMAGTVEQRISSTQDPPTIESFEFADWTDEQLAAAAEEEPETLDDQQSMDEVDEDGEYPENAGDPLLGDDNVEAYNKAVEDQPLAKQIIQVFWISISGDFAAPIATFAIESMTHVKFKPIIDRVFKTFDSAVKKVEINLDTRFVVCDGSTYSDAYFRRQGTASDHRIPYPGNPEKSIWVISDPPHLMKKIRNVLLNPRHMLAYIYLSKLWVSKKRQDDLEEIDDEDRDSVPVPNIAGYHKRPDIYVTKRDFMPENEQDFRPNVSLMRPNPEESKVEVPLYPRYWLTRVALSGETVLKPKHIELTMKTKMNVKMAVQTCSSSVADYIWQQYFTEVLNRLEGTSDGSEPNPFPWPLTELLRQAEAFFSVANSMSLDWSTMPENCTNNAHQENKEHEAGMPRWMHKLIKCLLFFKNWKEELEKNNIDIGVAFITIPCFRHLIRAIRGLIGLFLEVTRLYNMKKEVVPICPRAVNQDAVENYFSLMRERVANSNPTLQQVREGTASLGFLFQMRAEQKFESEIGSYGAAQTTGAPEQVLQPPSVPSIAAQIIPVPSMEHEAVTEENFHPEGFNIKRLEGRHRFEIRQHLFTSLHVAKLKLPTNSISDQEKWFLTAVEKEGSSFDVLMEFFCYLHWHSRKWFFTDKSNYFNANVREVTGHYLYSEPFRSTIFSSSFLRKMGVETLPAGHYIEALLKHFIHRSYVYFVRLDGLSPKTHKELALRARLETNMRHPTNSSQGSGRSYGDTCLRCKQVGHWSTECPQNPDRNHLQNKQCYNCQAYGHFARSCPHSSQPQPFRCYPANVSLNMILERLKTSNLETVAEYVPYMPSGDEGKLGIKQHSHSWNLKHEQCGQITGSTASYALVESTEKKQMVTAKSARIRQTFYNCHSGNTNWSQSMESIAQELYGSTRGLIGSDDVKLWGSVHESSAIVTLLKNVPSIFEDVANHQFLQVGMLKVGNSVWSSPDGLLVITTSTGERMRMAVEAKCPIMAGKPVPAKSVPWRHYTQVLLEMVALQAESAIYISWTPVGSTIFKIERKKLLESRLIEYLDNFASAAHRKTPYTHGKCQETLGQTLTTEIKELAKQVTAIHRCDSIVDSAAKQATQPILDKLSHNIAK